MTSQEHDTGRYDSWEEAITAWNARHTPDTGLATIPPASSADALCLDMACAEVKRCIPAGTGFTLFVFDLGSAGGRVAYASNANMDDMIESIGFWLQTVVKERVTKHQQEGAKAAEAGQQPPVKPAAPEIHLPTWIGSTRLSLAEIGALACCACAAVHANRGEDLPDAMAARMRSKDIRNAMVGLHAKGVLVTKDGMATLALEKARHPKDGGAV